MAQVLFDTHNAIEDLKRGGFTEDQAKANVRFIKEVLEGGVATKRDLDELQAAVKNDLDTLQSATKRDLENATIQLEANQRQTEGVMMAEMQRLQGDVNVVRAEMDVLRSDMRAFRFQILAAIAGATGVLGMLRFII
ncbi:MAG: hypothetical protein AAF903_03165 [Pseudomonadota bacterium]